MGAPDRDRPKTAILGPQFCRILVLGPHFWWSGPPLDPPLMVQVIQVHVFFLAIVLSVSLAFDVYGPDSINSQQSPTSWCWIKEDVSVLSVVFWQFFCGKFWEITAYVIVSIFYAIIVCFLKRQVCSLPQ